MNIYNVIIWVDNIKNCWIITVILPKLVIGNKSEIPTPACMVVLNKKKSKYVEYFFEISLWKCSDKYK